MSELDRHIFFIGPRKTGTTTIYDVLRASGVRTPLTIKETFFFEQDTIDLTDYQTRYNLDPTEPFVEVSPSYFSNETARRNLKALFPEAWIVITLRDPVKRCLSVLSHIERVGFITVSDEFNTGRFESNKHVKTMLATSHFNEYIDLWATTFPGRTIVMRQNANGEFDADALAKTAEVCGIPLPSDSIRETRSNYARTSISPRFVRVAKKAMRDLDRIGLGAVRRALKPLSWFVYRTAPPPDPRIEKRLEELLADSRAQYEAMPIWNLR
ncbi:hypothetical protein [Ruegeria arenilitoris]|uniref:hypothetical protein n=1 Tax=Ruegeria arenilitoris TaxID=1173585 RepID=UPI00147F75ED|nr:hypothetical protein [Ruegeria arenilitoris]